jgi:hypothetical protein
MIVVDLNKPEAQYFENPEVEMNYVPKADSTEDPTKRYQVNFVNNLVEYLMKKSNKET